MIIIDRLGNLMVPTDPRDRPRGMPLKDYPRQKFFRVHPVVAAVRKAIRP